MASSVRKLNLGCGRDIRPGWTNLDRAALPVLRDIHRILTPGGRLVIRTPHFTSRDSYADPTHCRLFSVETLRFFVRGHERDYYFDFSFSKIESMRLGFLKRTPYLYNFLIEWAVNYSSRTLNFYERSPLRIFPAANIETILVK
jgi:hypothetical protein